MDRQLYSTVAFYPASTDREVELMVTQATGTTTPAANPADATTATLSDGRRVTIFEFNSDGAFSDQDEHISVPIQSTLLETLRVFVGMVNAEDMAVAAAVDATSPSAPVLEMVRRAGGPNPTAIVALTSTPLGNATIATSAAAAHALRICILALPVTPEGGLGYLVDRDIVPFEIINSGDTEFTLATFMSASNSPAKYAATAATVIVVPESGAPAPAATLVVPGRTKLAGLIRASSLPFIQFQIAEYGTAQGQLSLALDSLLGAQILRTNVAA